MSVQGGRRGGVLQSQAAMPELILHHYAGSPYAEKIRCLLRIKGLPWRSLEVSSLSSSLAAAAAASLSVSQCHAGRQAGSLSMALPPRSHRHLNT